jgi:hypothetical protein
MILKDINAVYVTSSGKMQEKNMKNVLIAALKRYS